MAYQTFSLAELIHHYSLTLRSLLGVDTEHPTLSSEIRTAIKIALARRLTIIGSALDRRNSWAVRDIYQSLAN